MLKLIKIEFLKLRHKKLIWIMLLAALFMPLISWAYFRKSFAADITPLDFYKWSMLGYTSWIILPVVLGVLCTLLMYDEKINDVLKQLWIVPVSRAGYFLGKFSVVLIYSVIFVTVDAGASVLIGVGSGTIPFTWDSVWFLLLKSLEIGVLMSFGVLPILAVAAAQKGYIMPVCVTLVYTFAGFILLMINMYLCPLSAVTAIVIIDIPGASPGKAINIPAAVGCIGVWAIGSVLYGCRALRKGA